MIQLGALILASVIITRDKPYMSFIPLLFYYIGITSLDPFQYALVGFIAMFLGYHSSMFLKIFK
jgi:hypothetical protein